MNTSNKVREGCPWNRKGRSLSLYISLINEVHLPVLIVDLIAVTGRVDNVESQADAIFLDDWMMMKIEKERK